MSLGELFLIAVGLSMDAFAVSVCKGLASGKARLSHMGVAAALVDELALEMHLAGDLPDLDAVPALLENSLLGEKNFDRFSPLAQLNQPKEKIHRR